MMRLTHLSQPLRTAGRQLQGEKSRQSALIPDSLVTPKVIPSTHFTVDGEAVDVVPRSNESPICIQQSWLPVTRKISSQQTRHTRWRLWIAIYRTLTPRGSQQRTTTSCAPPCWRHIPTSRCAACSRSGRGRLSKNKRVVIAPIFSEIESAPPPRLRPSEGPTRRS